MFFITPMVVGTAMNHLDLLSMAFNLMDQATFFHFRLIFIKMELK
jgi:hypothetical protein